METTLVLRLETPLLRNNIDPDWPLRPHEIWQQWRWWTKAVVAGALFEHDLLHGIARHDVVKVPTQEETDCIWRIVSQLGLDMNNSCFQMKFEEIDFGVPHEVTPGFRAQFPWLQSADKLWYIDRGSATLVIKELYPCHLDNRVVEMAMSTLALALRLSCFGVGGRRGLGCFHVRAYGRYRSLFEEELDVLIRRAMTTVGTVVKDVIRNPISKCSLLRRRESCELPPMPALATRRYDACVKDFTLTPYILLLVKRVHQEFLYNFFTHQKTRSYDNEKEVLKTWIISGISNRPSPLMMKISNYSAYLNVFVSADWPNTVRLRRISETDILATMAFILRELLEHVEKIGSEIEVVWPKPGRRAEDHVFA